ncbi:AP-2 complex subunit mu like protein [Verticillium longisporum]|nr:AP-2 complex subunit mu like protein [Verticillium longisporum]
MPDIARKVVICAAIDGLIVQPLSSKGQRPAQPVRIGYGDGAISPAPRDQLPDLTKPNASFEAFGVVGLITLSKLNFLITITRRHQVAQILGFPIYVVTEVAITPCASRQEAEDAVHRTSMQLQTRTDDTDTEDSDGDSTIELMAHAADEVDDQTQSEGSISAGVKSTVAEDGQKRNAGWSYTTTESPRASMDQRPDLEPPAASKVPLEEEDDRVNEAKASSLLPKLLRTAQILYGSSRSFFFSYDVDITRHWATRAQSPSDELPLYRRVEPTFFWNRNTSQPFIDSGNDALVLPLMQGFVGQREFIMDKSPPQHDEDANDALEMSNMSAPTSPPGSPPAEAIRGSLDLRGSEKKFLITVISRRSIKRAGLRYLRRGVDEDGHVANAVETEQILSNSSWDQSSKIYSFLQIRGSIPLFFTQSPYSLKPAPVIQHSTEANFEASKKHFERLHREYGMLQVVNLVEKHNVEATIGNDYQNTVVKLNETVFSDHTSQVPFEWFDFHAACRGMKFENVSLLLDAMRTKLDELGSTVEKDGELFLRQRGVLRTNCMDCLDRTNVCQSSFAKYMLESQLKAEGYDLSMQVDQQSAWFNTLWADNGDSVSKQYASTAAMKGDYTRYKTRNYRGMLNDLGFSLTRFYNGMVNDYFSQAAIDFLLGNVTSMVFQDVTLEDCQFHQCVKLGKFDSDRIISFVPPDGEFELMRYRATENVNLPFKVHAIVNEVGRTKVEYSISIKANFGSKLFATNVVVRIPTPLNTAKITERCTQGKARYEPSDNVIVWKIGRFAGQSEFVLSAEASLSSMTNQRAWSRPPLSLNFSLLMFTSSGLLVRYLKVFEKSNYSSVKWVRYMTRAGSYEIRF